VRRGEHGGILLRLLFVLVFVAFLAGLYLIRDPLLRFAGQAWMVDDPVAKADVIIVLGDDNYAGDRAFHAADLYRTGLAPVVVASGRALRSYAGIAEMIVHDLESFGVPEAAIVKFPQRAQNTREEAEALAPLISSRGWKRVLVVTSNYHARRARFIFERVLPAGVSVSVSGAHDSDFDPASWWEKRQGLKIFLGELLGYAVAWWELRGKPATPAGEGLLSFSPGDILWRAPPPVTDWKHTRFTGELPCTIVRTLPSSPGCSRLSPACGYGVSVGGDIHVA
jgi:uncharacterized SAM-binding protein YcdF (DUF218 family)